MANCPKCGEKIMLVKNTETNQPNAIKCANQKTEKKGNEFVEVGKCDFKINFKTKLHDLTIQDMQNLLNGQTVKIKDTNTMTLDLSEKYFTKIVFAEKFKEEEF